MQISCKMWLLFGGTFGEIVLHTISWSEWSICYPAISPALYGLAWSKSVCGYIKWRQLYEGWAQDWCKSDGCFSPSLISSPWRHYEDYNISFCKQWKFRCHCSYEQWHLNLHCLQRGPSCPYTRVSKICLSYYSLALNPRIIHHMP